MSRAAFNRASHELVNAIATVFDRFEPPLTVRQVYYQLAKDGLVPLSKKGYRQAQRLLVRVREEGIVPWAYFADRTRVRIQAAQWEDVEDFGETVRNAYRRDNWQSQPVHVEVWLEKQALQDVFKRELEPYGVPLYTVRGYGSLTFIHEAAASLAGVGKPKAVFYFGDHDASGVDIERDLHEKLRRYGGACDLTFERAAIHLEDVEKFDLQPFDAKETDSRTRAYRARHKTDAVVELDALPPDELRRRIRACVEKHMNMSAWQWEQAIELEEKASVTQVFGNLRRVRGG
jgi:hypothetical protein